MFQTKKFSKTKIPINLDYTFHRKNFKIIEILKTIVYANTSLLFINHPIPTLLKYDVATKLKQVLEFAQVLLQSNQLLSKEVLFEIV